MNEPIRYESIQEPLDEEERELMDPENWDWENPVEAVIAENPLVELPIKVTFEEYDVLAHVARTEGLSPHDFIKRSALSAARVRSPEPSSGAISRLVRGSRSG